MSKILFWYLFKDLLRIFFLASGALAGIMSFGGLLRPLTENGLDAAQVGKMLSYLTPAMMAYSLPVAALFATTVTYGRLAADNELTACRAAGMSYQIIGLPAFVLGLGVAALSLILLCFVVPSFSLRVEQVIYSNLGKVIVNKIERNHQIRFGTRSAETVFAESARMLPPDPNRPGDQLVELTGPTIVSYEVANKITGLRVPREFFTAQSATVRIHPTGSGRGENRGGQLWMDLAGGAKFPRNFAGDDEGGVQIATFGPMQLPNPIRENVKFLDIWKLLALAVDPSASERVSLAVDQLVRQDESQTFLLELAANGSRHTLQSIGPHVQTYVLSSSGPPGQIIGQDLVFNSEKVPPKSPQARQIRLVLTEAGHVRLTAVAAEAHVRARPNDPLGQMIVTVELYDLEIAAPGTQPTEAASWGHTFDVAMDPAVRAVRSTRTAESYLSDRSLDAASLNFLRRERAVMFNTVFSELHSRASFALSCLILVLVGCALGMMFRSGNFLSAFAVSFIPAMLCITLVVAGQQTAEHVPESVAKGFLNHNGPLQLGVALIWSGNVIVLALALTLFVKLRRR